MKSRVKYSLFHKDQTALHHAAPIIFLGILMIGVLAFLLLNTVQTGEQLTRNVVNYANDMSAQLASNISARMNLRKSYILNLADTFSRMPDSLLTEELLSRKAAYIQMDEIFLLNSDGTCFPDEAHPGLKNYLTEHPELYTDASIFFTNQEKVFFSAPILRENSDPQILIGTRSNGVLQNMLLEVDSKNYGLSCIVNRDGTVIVSPTDLLPFQEINDILNHNPDPRDHKVSEKVLNDIQNLRSDLVWFEDIGGEPLLMSYDFLGINDWMLLTLIPQQLLSKGIEKYLIRYLLIFGLTALAAILTFVYIMRSYRHSLTKIRTISLTDTLTGGKNNLAFRLEGEHLLLEHPRQPYAILFLNIRNFKRYNERFGVKRGNQLLLQIYRILNSCLRKGELLTRASGDHFYLLLECSCEESVQSRLSVLLVRLEKKLTEAFSIDRSQLALGAYLIQKSDPDFLILQDRAKIASTYQKANESCRFYDEALSAQISREQRLNDSFADAIQNHEFKLYLQPKICLRQDQICGGEVLVRWEHPEYGLLFPNDFIPLFERNGKICELDFYMFEETCRLMADWISRGCAIPLSVNLSRMHLASSDLTFPEHLRRIKEQYQIPDGMIELELTESLMIEYRDISLVATVIDRIREAGFPVSIDDFGFGYSSLALLKDLNVNTIKLDRQFFLRENEKCWIVVRQLISLAHELRIKVVAEGVEVQAQADKLHEFGCDQIQGYVYAKPMSLSEFRDWLAAGQ